MSAKKLKTAPLEKFIGRVTTDTELGPLYRDVMQAASITVVDRITATFHRPSPQQDMIHANDFEKKRQALFAACHRRDISTPLGFTLLSCQRFILREMLLHLH